MRRYIYIYIFILLASACSCFYIYGAEGYKQSSFNVVYVTDWGAFSGVQFSRLLCLDLRNLNVKNNVEVLLV
jgi:hypothetical protein